MHFDQRLFAIISTLAVFMTAVEAVIPPRALGPSNVPTEFPESTSSSSAATATATVAATVFIPDARPKPSDSPKGLGSDTLATPLAVGSAESSDGSDGTTNTLPGFGNSSSPWGVDPTIIPDVPITAIFLILFLAGSCVHGWRCHKVNATNERYLRPTLSSLVLGFCILRVVACVLRIVWTTRPGSEALMISDMIILEIG